jgi:isopropylmalate/homocitrate/citramalate synthase
MVKLLLSVQANDALLKYRITGEIETEIQTSQKATITKLGIEVSPENIKDIYSTITMLEDDGYSADYI